MKKQWSIMILIILLSSSFAFAVEPLLDEDQIQEIKNRFGIDLTDEVGAIEVEVNDIQANSKGRLTIIEGVVTDVQTGNPVPEGTPVRIYCDHEQDRNLISDTETDEDGYFSAWTFNLFPSKRCSAGDEAFVKVDYQQQLWTSDPVGVSSGEFYDYAGIETAVGVPEFSTVTLALAIIGGSLGLVVLRKD